MTLRGRRQSKCEWHRHGQYRDVQQHFANEFQSLRNTLGHSVANSFLR